MDKLSAEQRWDHSPYCSIHAEAGPLPCDCHVAEIERLEGELKEAQWLLRREVDAHHETSQALEAELTRIKMLMQCFRFQTTRTKEAESELQASTAQVSRLREALIWIRRFAVNEALFKHFKDQDEITGKVDAALSETSPKEP